MLFAGLDPSYSRTGVSIYDTEKNYLKLDAVSKIESTDKTYQMMFKRMNLFSDRVLECLYSEGDLDTLISEEPLPTSQFSSGLYALDSIIFNKVINRGINKIYNLHPTYLKFVKEAKKSIKSESVILGKEIIKSLEDNGIEIRQTSSRLNNDTAESLIFLFRLLTKYRILLPSGKRVSDLIIRPRFSIEKEKLLFITITY